MDGCKRNGVVEKDYPLAVIEMSELAKVERQKKRSTRYVRYMGTKRSWMIMATLQPKEQ